MSAPLGSDLVDYEDYEIAIDWYGAAIKRLKALVEAVRVMTPEELAASEEFQVAEDLVNYAFGEYP